MKHVNLFGYELIESESESIQIGFIVALFDQLILCLQNNTFLQVRK